MGLFVGFYCVESNIEGAWAIEHCFLKLCIFGEIGKKWKIMNIGKFWEFFHTMMLV
jgi:hypothetical protein